MSYVSSKIPLKEGLALAAKRSNLTPEELKSDFRKALLLGDIQAEGRILQDETGWGDWSWSWVTTIPREFFCDNQGRDYIWWVVKMFGGYDRAPEGYFRSRYSIKGRDLEPMDEEDGDFGPPWAITAAGRAELGALGRPDFENNSTGDPGQPHRNPRRAIEIHVLREDVMKVFKPPVEATTPGGGEEDSRRQSEANWHDLARRFLESRLENDPDSFPATVGAAGTLIREHLRLGPKAPPVRKTVTNWLSRCKVLEAVNQQAAASRRINRSL